MHDYKRTVIEHALDNLIQSLDGKDDENSNIVRESAKRTKAVLSHIVINGITDIGVTFEDLIEELNNKPNVYILSDQEVQELQNTKKLLGLIYSSGFKLPK